MVTKIVLPPGLMVVKKPGRKAKEAKVKDPVMVKRGKHARRKGHGFERDIASMLRLVGFPQACRNLEYQGGEGYDIDNAGIYDIQCKRGKKYCNASVIKEVPKREGRIQVLITKADKLEALAVMPFEHFLEIMKK